MLRAPLQQSYKQGLLSMFKQKTPEYRDPEEGGGKGGWGPLRASAAKRGPAPGGGPGNREGVGSRQGLTG